MLKTAFCIISGAFFVIYLSSCRQSKGGETSALPYYNTPDFTPLWLNSEQAANKITHRVGNFSFTNQNGKTVNASDLKGKIHVANFFFSSCGSICPKMTENFRRLQQRFIHNDELLLLSFSVTPWIDSVPRLQLFAKKNNVNPGKWHLLTGNKADIYRIARQSYFAEEEMGITKDSTEFLHTEHFLLVDQTGKLRGIYNGTLALETERLMDDIDLLIRGE